MKKNVNTGGINHSQLFQLNNCVYLSGLFLIFLAFLTILPSDIDPLCLTTFIFFDLNICLKYYFLFMFMQTEKGFSCQNFLSLKSSEQKKPLYFWTSKYGHKTARNGPSLSDCVEIEYSQLVQQNHFERHFLSSYSFIPLYENCSQQLDKFTNIFCAAFSAVFGTYYLANCKKKYINALLAKMCS